MVTGDNVITARSIAYTVGIINPLNESKAIVMEGPEFLWKIGGVICQNCKELPKCECVKNEYELKKPENKNKKIRVDTI
jgi:Ca2+ transporting ATPase